ncbi:hypothetical protein CGRA01v4_03348 [Colletotrichum graminicola]|nr:hypothetical protein CGRA01v4_03348 [Colletotrichum graminicola]
MACPRAGSFQRRGPFRRRGDVGLFLRTCWTRQETGGPFPPKRMILQCIKVSIQGTASVYRDEEKRS